MKIPRCYWDSSVFLAFLTSEDGRVSKCLEVIRAARRKEVQIVTSAVTLAEVIHLKGVPKKFNDKDEKKIAAFFLHEFIVVVYVDRVIAEASRQLIWKYNLKPYDAVHLATALHHSVPVFHAYDKKDLIALAAPLKSRITIMEPSVTQPDLPFEHDVHSLAQGQHVSKPN